MTAPAIRGFVPLFLFALLPAVLQAQSTATLNASGNWNGSPGIWSGGIAPNNGNNGQNWNAIVNANTVTVDAAVSIQGLTLNGGTITGAQSLTVNAASMWGIGTMSGTGSTTFASGSTLSLGTANITINNRTVTNGGAATWSSGSSLVMTFANSGTFNNSGTYNANQTSGTMSMNSGPGLFDNTGEFNKNGGGDRGGDHIRGLQQQRHRQCEPGHSWSERRRYQQRHL